MRCRTDAQKTVTFENSCLVQKLCELSNDFSPTSCWINFSGGYKEWENIILTDNLFVKGTGPG